MGALLENVDFHGDLLREPWGWIANSTLDRVLTSGPPPNSPVALH